MIGLRCSTFYPSIFLFFLKRRFALKPLMTRYKLTIQPMALSTWLWLCAFIHWPWLANHVLCDLSFLNMKVNILKYYPQSIKYITFTVEDLALLSVCLTSVPVSSHNNCMFYRVNYLSTDCVFNINISVSYSAPLLFVVYCSLRCHLAKNFCSLYNFMWNRWMDHIYDKSVGVFVGALM